MLVLHEINCVHALSNIVSVLFAEVVIERYLPYVPTHVLTYFLKN